MLKFLKLAVLGVVLSTFAEIAEATTQVFVFTPEGVWLASDTLRIHSQDGVQTPETVCKVVLSPSRLFFNAGFFADSPKLEKEEAELPLEDGSATAHKVIPLLNQNQMTGNFTQLAGFVQTVNGHVQAALFGYDAGHHLSEIPVILQLGVLQGFGGDAFKERQTESLKGTDYWRSILANPKLELTKVLQAEVDTRKGQVGPPFTILLLKMDGSIVDRSDDPVCKVPPALQQRPSP